MNVSVAEADPKLLTLNAFPEIAHEAEVEADAPPGEAPTPVIVQAELFDVVP